MKIGDKVRVVDCGEVYAINRQMANKMGLKKYCYDSNKIVCGVILTVSSIQPDQNKKNLLVGCYCEPFDEDFIIGILGVEVVKDEPLSKLVAEQEAEIEKLKILLGEARCSNCYGDGANYDGHGEIHQCQWCHETKEILEANNETNQ